MATCRSISTSLPESLEKAKKQFAQAKTMIEAFEKYFGEYPFRKDGYKLIEVPYSGMEHQSAVTYGNRFSNGYLERDWTGVGVSMKFDFIIIHESAHEWFGNAVTAADVSDMWIHEAWGTYMENLYVEHAFGYEDALKYMNGYKSKVAEPRADRRAARHQPHAAAGHVFQGRAVHQHAAVVVEDDVKWWKLLRSFYQAFKYRTITTEDVVAFFNRETGKNLTPIFDQYLRHAQLPGLDLVFQEGGQLAYRWHADVRDFAMPIKVGRKGAWQVITPTTDWQVMTTPLAKDEFEVATELYYVDVVKM